MFIQFSLAENVYIYAEPNSYHSNQRHLSEDDCKDNAVLINQFSTNQPAGVVLIELDISKETAIVFAGILDANSRFSHANIWNFPRAEKASTTNLTQDKFNYSIREKDYVHWVDLNRVKLSGSFYSDEDVAPCDSSSTLSWDIGTLISEEQFNEISELIRLKTVEQDLAYGLLYKKLKKF
tara:strand:+ start:78 stop:617 length:540 start_codon:yes stop_codon:yes gene_type:complete